MTRIRKTVPASRCTSCWSASPSRDLRRAHRPANDVRAGSGGAFSEPVSAKICLRLVNLEA